MATTATETTSLIAIKLPSTPYSAWMARYYVRAALRDHDLRGYAADAAAVTSELVTNAIIHTGADAIGLELTCPEGAAAVTIVVTDPCSRPPVMVAAGEDAEHGRGLRMVEALSTRWGWTPQGPGKAVFAVLTREG
jgi:anti-sigma regulatory factor (Ser/Thr protein kinase)